MIGLFIRVYLLIEVILVRILLSSRINLPPKLIKYLSMVRDCSHAQNLLDHSCVFLDLNFVAWKVIDRRFQLSVHVSHEAAKWWIVFPHFGLVDFFYLFREVLEIFHRLHDPTIWQLNAKRPFFFVNFKVRD